jgi:hypothetical protein
MGILPPGIAMRNQYEKKPHDSDGHNHTGHENGGAIFIVKRWKNDNKKSPLCRDQPV